MPSADLSPAISSRTILKKVSNHANLHIVDQMPDQTPRPVASYPGFAESPKKRSTPAILKKFSKSVRNLKEPDK